MSAAKLPACLAGAGFLGHTWLVTAQGDTGERLCAQCSYGVDAARCFDELPSDRRGRIFTRYKKTWRAVRVEAARLDGRP